MAATKRRRGRKGKQQERRKEEDDKNNYDNSSSFQKRTRLIPTNEPWWECAKNTMGRNETLLTSSGSSSSFSIPKQEEQEEQRRTQTSGVVEKYRSQADDLLRTEVALYSQQQHGNKDDAWIESTIKRGTLKDRIAAMSVVVSSSPVHKLHALDGLLGMTGGGDSSSQGTNSRVAQMAAEALEDLFLNTLLPNDRKLVRLDQRPLWKYENNNNNNSNNNNIRSLSPRILLLWRFEELMKEKYNKFLSQYVQSTLRDGMDRDKVSSLRCASRLLRALPEAEQTLLQILVNKLGDPTKKVAAAAGHELRNVLEQHPQMQTIVAREVQQLAHRPSLRPRALYNCIIFLNQLRLSNKRSQYQDTKLPASLIKTYFQLFEVAVGSSSSIHVSSKNNKKNKNKQYKKTKKNHEKKDTTGVVVDNNSTMSGRLLSALLTGVNRARPYLPTADQDLEQHMDALYRVAHTAPPGASTQALMLLFHVSVGGANNKHEDDKNDDDSRSDDDEDDDLEQETNNKQQSVLDATVLEKRQDRFYRALYAQLSSSSSHNNNSNNNNNNLLCTGKHTTLFFNLLYKAIKYDPNETRVIVFCKALLCTVLHTPPPISAASLFLVKEVLQYHDDLDPCIVRQQQQGLEELSKEERLAVLDATKRDPRSALMMMVGTSKKEEEVSKHDENKKKINKAPLWGELQLLQHSFHPSVSKFATYLSEGHPIDYTGDPLVDFGLMPFLDKFAYKNPKKAATTDGGTTKTKTSALSGQRHYRRAERRRPMNDASFLKETHVNETDEFFHKFFLERAKRDERKGIVRSKSSQKDDDEDELLLVDQAFDAMENKQRDIDVDNVTYEWDTDSEEEEFVDKLATQLMEESAVQHGEQADYDDEDPDMEGWDDMYDDKDEEIDGKSRRIRKTGKRIHDGDDSDEEDDSETGNAGPMHISELLGDGSDNETKEDDTRSSKDSGGGGDADDYMDDDSDSSDEEEEEEETIDESDLKATLSKGKHRPQIVENIAPEEDEEIDSDAAFDSNDEKLYGAYFKSKSRQEGSKESSSSEDNDDDDDDDEDGSDESTDSSDDDDDGGDFPMPSDDDSSTGGSSDEDKDAPRRSKRSLATDSGNDNVFADASLYEERISNSWSELNKNLAASAAESDEEEEEPPRKKKRSRKKSK